MDDPGEKRIGAPALAGGDDAPVSGVSELSLANFKAALGCLLGQMFGSSMLPYGALPLLMLPMTREFGWSETAFSGAVSFFMVCGALSGPVIGHYADRAGVRRAIIGGTLIIGLATLAMSLAPGSIWFLYLAYGVIGIVGSTALGYVKVISGLFRRNRGKALAVFGAEAALAGALTPLIVEAVLSQAGWRAVYLVLGGLILLMVPVLYALLVEPPADEMATSPLSSGRAGEGTVAPLPLAVPGLTARETRATPTYWLLIVATLLAAAPRLGFLTFIVPVLTEKGFSSAAAAWSIACITISAPVGTLLAGAVMDRFQTPRAIIPFFLVALVATGLFAVLTSSSGGIVGLVLTSLLFGMTFQVHIPMMSYFHGRYFGLPAFTENYGLAVAALAIGIGLSTPLLGYIRAATDSTGILVAVVCGMLAVAIVMLGLVRPFPDKAA